MIIYRLQTKEISNFRRVDSPFRRVCFDNSRTGKNEIEIVHIQYPSKEDKYYLLKSLSFSFHFFKNFFLSILVNSLGFFLLTRIGKNRCG